MRRVETPRDHRALDQERFERRNRIERTRDDAKPGCIYRSEIDVRWKQRQHIILGHPHDEHRARW